MLLDFDVLERLLEPTATELFADLQQARKCPSVQEGAAFLAGEVPDPEAAGGGRLIALTEEDSMPIQIKITLQRAVTIPDKWLMDHAEECDAVYTAHREGMKWLGCAHLRRIAKELAQDYYNQIAPDPTVTVVSASFPKRWLRRNAM